MNTRIKNLRKTLNLTQQEFANKLKFSRTTISSFESRAKVPSEKTLEYICIIFNVNKEWLINGTGDIFYDDVDKISLYNEILELLDDDDQENLQLIKDYMYLSEEDKILTRQLIERLTKQDRD